MNSTVKLIIIFISLILLQVTILDHVDFLGYIDPYLYISFIFIFPIHKNKFYLLIFSFLLGVIIDSFMNSGGINAIACITTAYVRFYLFKRIFQKSESDYELFNLKEEPKSDVFTYIGLLTLIHHFLLFSLINFSLDNLLINVIYNTVISSILTLILYFTGSFILRKQSQNAT